MQRYYRDILPLLQSSCQSCHRDGEPGAELFCGIRLLRNGRRDVERDAEPNRESAHAALAREH